MSWRRKRMQFVKRNYSTKMKCIMVLWRIFSLDWKVNHIGEQMLLDEAKGDELIAIDFRELWMNWNFSFFVFIFVFILLYFVNMILLTHFCTFLKVFVWISIVYFVNNFQNYNTYNLNIIKSITKYLP